MNVDFLTRQAVKKSPLIKKWNAEMNDELYGTSSADRTLTGMDILTDGLWGTSMVISNATVNLITGLAAASLGGTSYVVSGLKEKRSKKQMMNLLSKVKDNMAKTESDIQVLYALLKDGSLEARTKLVEMTSEEDVEEVETNMVLDSYFKTKRGQL